MHSYFHHIGDFNTATRHLSRVERSIYRDLIDLYYETERCLTLDMKALCRRVIARSEEEISALETVLQEFFEETSEGWMHPRCQQDIDAYHAKAERNRQVGKLGGRPRKSKEKPSGFFLETEINPNQEPRTSNHKPVTKNQEITPPLPPKGETYSEAFNQFWSAYPRKEAKGAAAKSWKAQKLDGKLSDILAGLELYKRCEQWTKDQGRFIPHPTTWLNQRRWEDEPGVKAINKPIDLNKVMIDRLMAAKYIRNKYDGGDLIPTSQVTPHPFKTGYLTVQGFDWPAHEFEVAEELDHHVADSG